MDKNHNYNKLSLKFFGYSSIIVYVAILITSFMGENIEALHYGKAGPNVFILLTRIILSSLYFMMLIYKFLMRNKFGVIASLFLGIMITILTFYIEFGVDQNTLSPNNSIEKYIGGALVLIMGYGLYIIQLIIIRNKGRSK